MTDPFLAEIRVVGFNFAPSGWAFCNGQILPIAQNTALFAVIGTTYGGDGTTSFGLPNLQDRAVLGPRTGPGLSTYALGQEVGTTEETLSTAKLPAHDHTARANPDPAELQTPTANRALARGSGGFPYQSNTAGSLVPLDDAVLDETGGGGPHNNRSPLLVLRFVIALVGQFPS